MKSCRHRRAEPIKTISGIRVAGRKVWLDLPGAGIGRRGDCKSARFALQTRAFGRAEGALRLTFMAD